MSSTFLSLTSEASEPFVIPNVSPVSSPKLTAKSSRQSSISETLASLRGRANSGGTSLLKPLAAIDDHDSQVAVNDGEELLPVRKLSAIDLN
ncbi:hypothetical protein PVL30_002750 [Lodderomyces elongisporus]|uniref:uncharacterized protein n=1 Tax=Lodderomyces elongisporus TaxID=36914 RepID=UPI00291E56C8|nr:uncharacterized protein PVL30_002750 [Lodderomyces elongisporus]WLF79001.1 hypothetical protein PVL30_002750 [Lodderomyces elongisporus]